VQPQSKLHKDNQPLAPAKQLALVDLILKADNWDHPMKFTHILAFAHRLQDLDI
jgi:hypothetical protein